MKKNFTHGEPVYIVQRDEDGTACDVSGYLFLAKVEQAVIVTPRVFGCAGLEEILEYHIEQTAQDYDTCLSVYPARDCYERKDEAESVIPNESDID